MSVKIAVRAIGDTERCEHSNGRICDDRDAIVDINGDMKDLSAVLGTSLHNHHHVLSAALASNTTRSAANTPMAEPLQRPGTPCCGLTGLMTAGLL
jgi:hypothetical protein